MRIGSALHYVLLCGICGLIGFAHADGTSAPPQQSPADFSQFGGANTPEDSEAMWLPLREKYFAERPLVEGKDSRVTIEAPARAENDAAVPVKIHLQADANDPFSKVYLVVDVNPMPLGGLFTLTTKRPMDEISTLVRVNGYTYIRAIGETTQGKLYLAKQWVKSTGAGCSAPPGIDQQEHQKRLGNMRLIQPQKNALFEPRLMRLVISHPNNTGMQKDQLSTLPIPEHYITAVKVFFNDQPLLEAETSFTLSENPSFGFNFSPDESGELRAEVTDSQQKTFSYTTSIHGVER